MLLPSKSYYPSEVLIEQGGYKNFLNFLPAHTQSIYVVSGKSSMKNAGVLDNIKKICIESKIKCFFSEGISSNPTNQEIDIAYEFCKKVNADSIIGIGGGSSLDAVKIISMLVKNGGKSWDYINTKERKGIPITKKPLPFILIPTTSGTASESTPYAVITNAESKMKKGMGSKFLYPKACIIDPELLSLMPKDIVAQTGFDAFAQALEGYTSKKSTFHSEYYGFSALKLLIENFEASWESPKNLDKKINMAWGTLLSGLSIGIVDTNLAHALSHPLSAYYNIHHGLAVFLCTCQSIKFNETVLSEKYAKVCELFGNKNGSAATLIKNIKNWGQKFSLTLGLKNYNIPRQEINALVEDALEIGCIKTNPRLVAKKDVYTLYEKIWEGEIE